MSQPARPGSYQSAGVDIERAERAKARIAARVAALANANVIGGIGHFGGFFRAPRNDKPLVLVSTADSVGTKVMLAGAIGAHYGIGVDLVNHCVNDLLATGARPLFFLDYYATPELDPEALAEVVDGLADACEAAGCALVGGETAQLPGIYREGTYDLAGFMVGSVAEDEIVDGSAIRSGDVLVGLPSSGLHTNGFSLARVALGLNVPPAELRRRLEQIPLWADRSLGQLLLEPHRSYLPVIEPLLGTGAIHGMAHITGGGLAGNLRRVIPNGLLTEIELGSWSVPRLFTSIAESGQIDQAEMYRVFNMGIGFVAIVAADDVPRLAERDPAVAVIGRIVPSTAPERVRLARAGGAA